LIRLLGGGRQQVPARQSAVVGRGRALCERYYAVAAQTDIASPALRSHCSAARQRSSSTYQQQLYSDTIATVAEAASTTATQR